MLIRKLFRTIWEYKAQFISMIIMTTLGIGIFVGFNVEWFSVNENTTKFMKETGYADFRIVSENGFSDTDLEKIEKIYGDKDTARYVSLKGKIQSGEESNGDTLSISTTENINVSGFIVKEGEKYTDTNGVWISEKYAKINNISIGDNIEILCNNISFNTTVKGLIQSSEYMICLQNETQMMPDYKTHGYAYISPTMLKDIFGYEFYSQIHVISNDEKSEFISKADSALGVTSMIIAKDETRSYSASQGEIEEGKIMGSVLPVVFLLISVLTMVTTMYRIANKEQIQIGTLKALGFKNRKILTHYTLYSIIIGGIGAILGVGLGYGLAYTIVNPNGSMGTYLDMPYWNLLMPFFGYIVIIFIILLLVLIGLLAVYKILKPTAAEILRNNQGKKVKSLKIEKTKWFHKKSFGTRWNLRDILHNKARTTMSLIGVIGCTIILLGSLGINDTMNKFLDTYYNKAMHYNSKIYISEKASTDQIQKLTEQYGNETSATIGVKIQDKAVALDIYNIENDFIKFISIDGEYTKISNDGAYICKRISEKYSLDVGDTFVISPYGQNREYSIKISGIICSVTENIVMSEEYADKLKITYSIDSIYTEKENIEEQDGIKVVESKQELMETFNSALEIMNSMIIILVIVGLLLSIVVLYNLGVMGYTQRYREMATLKVLGFKDKKISSLLITQNLWISIIGIIIGIPLGYITLNYLLTAMASEYEMNLFISIQTYLISICLNLGVSLLVSIMISKKNKNIDMVEALKNAE